MRDHQYFMQLALTQAQLAKANNEVPVGAILVEDKSQQVIASAFNQPISNCDPTAHAEINVLRKAAIQFNNYRLPNTTLYVTLEPCAMCAGAMIHARISQVVFAAYDHKAGAAGSVINILQQRSFNHQTLIVGGVLEQSAVCLLQQFFQERR